MRNPGVKKVCRLRFGRWLAHSLLSARGRGSLVVPLPDDIHGLESRKTVKPTSGNDEVRVGFPERDQDLLKEVRKVSRQEVVSRSHTCRKPRNVG